MLSPQRVPLAACAVALVAGCLVAPSSSAGPGPGGFTSPNVTWVGNVPLDAPAIGGRVLTVKGQRRFYISGTKGLSIYDVTNPALPVPLGTLAMPHFENEAVAVSDDGSTVILSSDPSFGQPPLTYVVDTSVVTAPRVVSVIPDGSHTVTCANVRCSHIYANAGWVYDITNRAAPRPVDTARNAGADHYASRDAAGLLWDDGSVIDPRRDPERPTRKNLGSGGWHNNMRPNADKWRPRKASDTGGSLKPGELLIGNGETWLAPGKCSARSAGITTYSITNFDRGGRAREIDSILPVNGTFDDGNPPVDAVGCSAHWFDYRNGIVAAGWYDHGTRFIKVDERSGKMTEIGFHQAVVTEAWGAYWVTDEYVYSVDAVRGIDILRLDRKAKPTTPGRPSEPRPSAPLSEASRREQYVCAAVAGRV